MSGKLKFEAVIFDFDGVLVDSAEIKLLAFAELYKKYGQDAYDTAITYCKQNAGIPRASKFTYLHKLICNKKLNELELVKLSRSFSKIVVEQIINIPLSNELIDSLSSISNQIPCFVASATPEDELKEIVFKKKLDNFFEEVLGSPRSKLENIISILKKYKLEAKKVLLVGDSIHDFNSARDAQICFLAYAADLKEFPCGTHAVSNFKELRKWLYQ